MSDPDADVTRPRTPVVTLIDGTPPPDSTQTAAPEAYLEVLPDLPDNLQSGSGCPALTEEDLNQTTGPGVHGDHLHATDGDGQEVLVEIRAVSEDPPPAPFPVSPSLEPPAPKAPATSAPAPSRPPAGGRGAKVRQALAAPQRTTPSDGRTVRASDRPTTQGMGTVPPPSPSRPPPAQPPPPPAPRQSPPPPPPTRKVVDQRTVVTAEAPAAKDPTPVPQPAMTSAQMREMDMFRLEDLTPAAPRTSAPPPAAHTAYLPPYMRGTATAAQPAGGDGATELADPHPDALHPPSKSGPHDPFGSLRPNDNDRPDQGRITDEFETPRNDWKITKAVLLVIVCASLAIIGIQFASRLQGNPASGPGGALANWYTGRQTRQNRSRVAARHTATPRTTVAQPTSTVAAPPVAAQPQVQTAVPSQDCRRYGSFTGTNGAIDPAAPQREGYTVAFLQPGQNYGLDTLLCRPDR